MYIRFGRKNNWFRKFEKTQNRRRYIIVLKIAWKIYGRRKWIETFAGKNGITWGRDMGDKIIKKLLSTGVDICSRNIEINIGHGISVITLMMQQLMKGKEEETGNNSYLRKRSGIALQKKQKYRLERLESFY